MKKTSLAVLVFLLSLMLCNVALAESSDSLASGYAATPAVAMSSVSPSPTATPTPAAAQTTAAVSQESTSAAVISAAPSASPSVTTQGTASVSYSAHVQDIGWQSFVSDGATAGTTGEAKRVEAIKATLSGVSGSIDYHAYIQDIGWGQAWASNGAVAGTTGQAKRVEAVQFSLSGTAGEQYDVYYRVHVQDIGWMAWAKDGEIAGTSGMGLRIEAMQVVLVKKGDSAPSDDGSYYASYVAAPSLSYRAHVQDIGWQGWVDEGEMAGATGRALRVEAVQARLASGSDQVAGGIGYHVHIQDIGWDQAWASNGGTAGTTGQAKRVEAVQFSLSGAVADLYDVYYRVHIQDYGWLGWAEDGEIAGSTGRGLRVEAVQVELVRKGNGAPGETDGSYVNEAFIMGKSQVTAGELASWYKEQFDSCYPTAVFSKGGAATIDDYCKILAEEASAEGVRAEVAFAQTMLETADFQYGGDVSASQYNFAGIGATGNGVPGCSFPSVRIGIRAQIQHLKAYASTEDLNNACVDPRFGYVKRGCARTVYALSQHWAVGSDYGDGIMDYLDSILS